MTERIGAEVVTAEQVFGKYKRADYSPLELANIVATYRAQCRLGRVSEAECEQVERLCDLPKLDPVESDYFRV